MSSLTTSLVLASGSPRRLEILRAHGIEPQVIVSEFDEDAFIAALPDATTPKELAEQLALRKAQEVYGRLDPADFVPHTTILGADTVVYKEDVGVLGKPEGRMEAIAMLESLRNTAHQAITGVALIDLTTGDTRSFTDTTTVHFGDYDLAEIEKYLDLEPPFDKAGSYAVQGYWKKHVTAIEGDLENVIGLPFYRLALCDE